MTRAWLGLTAVLVLLLIGSRLQYAWLETELADAGLAHALSLKQISDTALAAQMSATQARDVRARDIAALDAKHYQALTETKHEIDRLAADVAAGRKRLLVAAKCPAGVDHVPGATSSAGLGDGARAELDPTSRPTHYALRRGLARVGEKLDACQSYVLAVRRLNPQGR